MTRDEMISKFQRAIGCLALELPPAVYRDFCGIADEFFAALSHPAPPDDLVAIVREWQAAKRALAEAPITTVVLAVDIRAAPAPVAAPAPETPANEHIVGYDPDGNPLMRVANINAAGNTDVGVYAMPQLKREPAPETPAPDAMPEAQVDDVIVREVTDSVRRIDGLGWAYLRDGAVWIGSGDASICRVERNGVVIWRRQEAQP